MSISSLNNNSQTGLVPQSLLGYSSNGVSALEINSTSITIAGDLNTPTPVYVGISAATGLTTTLATGLDVNCDFNMNSNDITNVDTISSATGGDLTLSSQTDINLYAGDNLNISCNNDDMTLTSGNYININSANNTFISPTASFIVNASDNVFLTANGDAMTLIADDDITLTSISKSIIINGGNGDGGDNNITLTTQNSTLQGSIILQSGGDIQLNAPNGGVIGINSGDNVQMSCGENFFVQTNSSTGLVILNTGDLSNSGVVRWNNYPMSMTFFNKWNGGFGYNTPTAWEMVKQNAIPFPTQFLYGTWAVSFSINCYNVGSLPADKELAMYFNFLDGNSNTFDGFNYRQQTPYANWFNASQYVNTSQNPLSITYTDYFDFTGAINDLQIQINWYGNQSYNQDFNVSTTFTLMTLI